MRRVVTAIDEDGKSYVLSDGAPPVAFRASDPAQPPDLIAAGAGPSPVPAGEAVVHQLWALSHQPTAAVTDPTLGMAAPDFDLAPGRTGWIVTEMGPGLDVAMHATTTVDYGVVLSGEVTMGLERGEVVLKAGDLVLVDAVQHSWRAGPAGCVIATVQVGIAPRDEHR